MALREAGEQQHDNSGGSRKLSAVASGHSMRVKEKHYEKVGEDFEQVHVIGIIILLLPRDGRI